MLPVLSSEQVDERFPGLIGHDEEWSDKDNVVRQPQRSFLGDDF